MVHEKSVGPRVGILAGVTAAGKTSIALEFAAARRGAEAGLEIVNADSLLVYRGMNVGTAKPTLAELAAAPHHLVDVREPNEPFTAGDFVREARAAIAAIHGRGARALIVGGTGFYLKALLYGLWEAPAADPSIRAKLGAVALPDLHARLAALDAESALRISPTDHYRLIRALELIELTGKTPTELQAQASHAPDPLFELWVLDRPDADLRSRISSRTRAMLAAGLLDETRALQTRFGAEARALGAVGYAQAVRHLDGGKPRGRKPRPGLEGLADEIDLATRQLVKSQRTWFRGQKTARWFTLDADRAALSDAMAALYSQSGA